MEHTIDFTDETIHQLFGFEDAESEPIERLREYYFKKDTFDKVISDLPLKILVGHKGTGKSALFKVAIAEEVEKGNLPILIKPDDIAELGINEDNFLLRIRQWKIGLIKIIGEKVFSEFGIRDDSAISKLSNYGLRFLNYLVDTVKDLQDKIELEPTSKGVIANF